MECNALPTLIHMLRAEDAGIHYEAVGVIGNLVHSSQASILTNLCSLLYLYCLKKSNQISLRRNLSSAGKGCMPCSPHSKVFCPSISILEPLVFNLNLLRSLAPLYLVLFGESFTAVQSGLEDLLLTYSTSSGRFWMREPYNLSSASSVPNAMSLRGKLLYYWVNSRQLSRTTRPRLFRGGQPPLSLKCCVQTTSSSRRWQPLLWGGWRRTRTTRPASSRSALIEKIPSTRPSTCVPFCAEWLVFPSHTSGALHAHMCGT